MITAFRKTAETFEAAKTLPQRCFVSPETFAEEQQNIFSRQWVLVGHQNYISEAGHYFVAEVGGESVIVVRDKHEATHAFYNVCRHRGSRLVEQRSGRLSGGVQCPYHAWTYGFDGRLLGGPHMDDVPDFNKADYSLHPVNLGIWEGFIFVNLRDASTQRGGYSVEEWFSPLAGKFSRWNLPVLRSAKRIEYDVRANWKLIFENYSECYHCAGVHPELSKISPSDSAENDLTEGPFLGGCMKINPGKSLTMSGNACALGITDSTRARDRVPAHNRNPSREIEDDHEHKHEGKNRVFYYSIFPNMLLSLHPDYVMVHQLQPKAPDHTSILCDWFFYPEAFGRGDFNAHDAIEFWNMVNKQDWHVCELSQQGIASRAYEPGPYSARESVPAAWDEYYLRVMS
jgi:Rieske 2Fe-2S family protein